MLTAVLNFLSRPVTSLKRRGTPSKNGSSTIQSVNGRKSSTLTPTAVTTGELTKALASQARLDIAPNKTTEPTTIIETPKSAPTSNDALLAAILEQNRLLTEQNRLVIEQNMGLNAQVIELYEQLDILRAEASELRGENNLLTAQLQSQELTRRVEALEARTRNSVPVAQRETTIPTAAVEEPAFTPSSFQPASVQFVGNGGYYTPVQVVTPDTQSANNSTLTLFNPKSNDQTFDTAVSQPSTTLPTEKPVPKDTVLLQGKTTVPVEERDRDYYKRIDKEMSGQSNEEVFQALGDGDVKVRKIALYELHNRINPPASKLHFRLTRDELTVTAIPTVLAWLNDKTNPNHARLLIPCIQVANGSLINRKADVFNNNISINNPTVKALFTGVLESLEFVNNKAPQNRDLMIAKGHVQIFLKMIINASKDSGTSVKEEILRLAPNMGEELIRLADPPRARSSNKHRDYYDDFHNDGGSRGSLFSRIAAGILAFLGL